MKIRYYTIEREVLIVIKYIAEIKYLVIDYKFSIIIYTNYQALELIIIVSINIYRRIIYQIDRLIEYNYIIYYYSSRTSIISLIDKILRILGRYIQLVIIEDIEYIIIVVVTFTTLVRPYYLILPALPLYIKYYNSKQYKRVIAYLLEGSKVLKKYSKTEI